MGVKWIGDALKSHRVHTGPVRLRPQTVGLVLFVITSDSIQIFLCHVLHLLALKQYRRLKQIKIIRRAPRSTGRTERRVRAR